MSTSKEKMLPSTNLSKLYCLLANKIEEKSISMSTSEIILGPTICMNEEKEEKYAEKIVKILENSETEAEILKKISEL